MQMAIQWKDFHLSDDVRDHTMKRLASRLRCGDGYITRVSVRLSDGIGTRAASDKCCRLEIHLKGMPDVMIEDIESDFSLAIERATERAGRTLARRMERLRECPAAARPAVNAGVGFSLTVEGA